jgi:hypothetical protein
LKDEKGVAKCTRVLGASAQSAVRRLTANRVAISSSEMPVDSAANCRAK